MKTIAEAGVPGYESTTAYASHLREELKRHARIVRAANIRLE